MKSRRVFKVLIGFLVVTSIFSITVFANYFTSSDSVTNNFETGSIEVGIAEKFTPMENWDGKEVSKKVKIKNTGENGELIRVSIIPRWVDENGDPWIGDTNFVKLNLENIVSLNELKSDDKNLWIDGGDGYYYYSNILENGEAENSKNPMSPSERYDESLTPNKDGSERTNYTSEILSSVSLDMSKLSAEDKARYIGKKLIVDVNTEAITPRKDEISDKWNNISASLKAYLDGIPNAKTGDEVNEKN